MKHRKYSDEQIDVLRKYYPDSNYDEIFKVFQGYSKKRIKAIASYYGIKSNNPGHRVNLKGKRFGKLTVIDFSRVKDGRIYWKCKCDCGNECEAQTQLLKDGRTKSCGCLIHAPSKTRKDHCGERFGILTAIERLPNYKNKRTYYRCLCDCGEEKIISGSSLVSGNTKSCGCISKNPKAYWEATTGQPYDDKRTYEVYKHETPNGKVYIGITKQTHELRWQGGNGYRDQKYFWNAIKKYGWDKIKHEVIEKGLSLEEACEKEQYYIKCYKSTNRKYGYNISEGGTVGKSLVIPVMQYYKGKPVNFFESQTYAAEMLNVTVRTIENYILENTILEDYEFVAMPEILRYDINPSLYEIRDESHFDISKKLLERRSKITIQRNLEGARKINQYDLEGHYIRTFDSIAEIKKTVPGTGSISQVLAGKKNCKTAGGYQWRYFDGSYEDNEPVTPNAKCRPVLQIDPDSGVVIAEYTSATEAGKALGISHTHICSVCKGQRKTCGGWKWNYKEEFNGQ